MKRRAFPFARAAAGTSLFLLLAALLAWWLSYYFHSGPPSGFNLTRTCHVLVWSGYGQAGVECHHIHGAIVQGPAYNSPQVAAWRSQFPPPSRFRRFGFIIGHEPMIATALTGTLVKDGTWSYLVVPYWALTLALALILAATLQGLRRRRRADRLKQNLCVQCGYDLRATPDRCPECGTKPKPEAIEGVTA